MEQSRRSRIIGASVWIVSSIAIFFYIGLAWFGYTVPGVEELVVFLSSIEGQYIYGAAFIAMFIEGLYFFGSFFPGSTLVVVIAILAQAGGFFSFILAITAVFLGWVLAGVVNIVCARTLSVRDAVGNGVVLPVRDRLWTTWFPAFRANYEVAQITEGNPVWAVFTSSVRVKIWATLAAALYAFLASLLIDVSTISNKEGFLSLAVVATITLVVGCVKLFKIKNRE
jgi:hypothetical protein